MSKTLKAIQVLSKIGKILSTIVFVCSIVGASLCLAGIISLSLGIEGMLSFGGVSIHGLIENTGGFSIGNLYATLIVTIILCGGEIALSKIAQNYFKHEIEAGTPFTFDGAKEMLRLGICGVAIPLGTVMVSSIVHEIIGTFMSGVKDFPYGEISIGLGVTFIIVSVILKYGAELSEKN